MDRSQSVPPLEPDDTVYPTSDGEPMAETFWHREQMMHLIESSKQLLAGRDDAAVSGNEFFYWERGNARKSVSPDVWVAFGLADQPYHGPMFKLWRQGKGPDLVIEVCSKSTRDNDFGRKKEIYRKHFEVTEYVIWDVDVDEDSGALDVHGLYAWRLDSLGRYRPVSLDEDGAFVSQVLAGARLRFDAESRFLRVVAPDGHVMPGSAREGRIEGRLEGVREMLVTALQTRFGAPPAWLRERIAGARSEAALRELFEAALSAPDIEALRVRLGG